MNQTRKNYQKFLVRDADSIYMGGACNPRGVAGSIVRHLKNMARYTDNCHRAKFSNAAKVMQATHTSINTVCDAIQNSMLSHVPPGDENYRQVLGIRLGVMSAVFMLTDCGPEGSFLRLMLSHLGHIVGAFSEEYGFGSGDYPGWQKDYNILNQALVDPWAALEPVDVIHEFRCSLPKRYQADCEGRSNPRGRQGYYIEAYDEDDARERLRRREDHIGQVEPIDVEVWKENRGGTM